ncbi:hypothetical protein EAO69_26960 [Streptomyces sp. me109]|nr:hypothetical protein EAO69_26960 [Streptomyces sp. me109]
MSSIRTSSSATASRWPTIPRRWNSSPRASAARSSWSRRGFSTPPPLPDPTLGAPPPGPPYRPERPRPQAPDGLEMRARTISPSGA